MDHIATMRRCYELINSGDIDGFGEFLADDFIEHEFARARRAAALQVARDVRAARR